MITVTGTAKPPRVSAVALAFIHTDAHHSYDEIVDAGLKALNETRQSLYGFGIESNSLRFRNGTDYGPIAPGLYVVFANRD